MAGKKIRTGILAGCGLAAAFVSAQQAKAVTVFNSNGFESPTYAAGSLVPQNGFTADPGSPTTVAANVIATGGNPGQAAQLTATNITPSTVQYFEPAVTPVNPSLTTVNIAFDLKSAFTNEGALGFGLTVFNNDGPKSAGFGLVELGNNNVAGDPNATPPEVDYQNGTGGATATYNTITGGVASGGYDHFNVSLDYATGGFTVSEGGTQIQTGTFSDAGGFYNVGLSAISFDGQNAASGTGTFDNLTVTAVPEPTTASLLVGGAVVAGLRRRRRSIAR